MKLNPFRSSRKTASSGSSPAQHQESPPQRMGTPPASTFGMPASRRQGAESAIEGGLGPRVQIGSGTGATPQARSRHGDAFAYPSALLSMEPGFTVFLPRNSHAAGRAEQRNDAQRMANPQPEEAGGRQPSVPASHPTPSAPPIELAADNVPQASNQPRLTRTDAFNTRHDVANPPRTGPFDIQAYPAELMQPTHPDGRIYLPRRNGQQPRPADAAPPNRPSSPFDVRPYPAEPMQPIHADGRIYHPIRSDHQRPPRANHEAVPHPRDRHLQPAGPRPAEAAPSRHPERDPQMENSVVFPNGHTSVRPR